MPRTPAPPACRRRSIGGMWLRRAFFWWLIPAAFVLPLWLLIGWIVFQPSGWALIWVLLIAMPSVFLGQLALTLLVRARGTVRAERAVSWWDVLGFAAWHVLTILVGLYSPVLFWPSLIGAVVVGLALFWMSLWQLWREARPSRVVLRTGDGFSYIPPAEPRQRMQDPQEVIVIAERPGPPAS
jgi:hypothetical protein